MSLSRLFSIVNSLLNYELKYDNHSLWKWNWRTKTPFCFGIKSKTNMSKLLTMVKKKKPAKQIIQCWNMCYSLSTATYVLLLCSYMHSYCHHIMRAKLVLTETLFFIYRKISQNRLSSNDWIWFEQMYHMICSLEGMLIPKKDVIVALCVFSQFQFTSHECIGWVFTFKWKT